MKKRMNICKVVLMIIAVLAPLFVPMNAYAADAEWRMMHGEQDAL